jgi:hypothetical protein
MWVLRHAEIQGNKKADQHAKTALQGETNKNYKTIAEDWKNWMREKQEGIRQAEWTLSDNPNQDFETKFVVICTFMIRVFNRF